MSKDISHLSLPSLTEAPYSNPLKKQVASSLSSLPAALKKPPAPKPEKPHRRMRENYDMLYSALKVCRACHDVYIVLQEYFDELHSHITGEDKKDPMAPAQKRGISQTLKEARAFSHMSVSLNQLDVRKGTVTKSRNNGVIKTTINSLTVGSVKGDLILKNGG